MRGQLCDRALLVGGPLEEYLDGVGLNDPNVVDGALTLFETLASAHPDLPESYVKLAVLMAVESGASISAETASATLEILAGCGDNPEVETASEADPEPQTAAAEVVAPEVLEPAPSAPEPDNTEDATEDSESAPPDVGDPLARFQEGVMLVDRGAVAEAEAVFRSLIATYPQLPEPYVNLAALLAGVGNDLAASQMAEEALLAHPLCRAAFELEMLRDFGNHSRTLLGQLGRPASQRQSSRRVVGPDWIPSPGENLEEIRMIAVLVNGWLAAWSERRTDDYLEFYADNFHPAGGDLRLWRADRRSRLNGSAPEELEISDLDVDVLSPVAGTASFMLHRRSAGDGVAVTVEKHLELEKSDGEWKIVAERPEE